MIVIISAIILCPIVWWAVRQERKDENAQPPIR